MLANGTAAEKLIGRVNEWPPFYFQQHDKWTGTNVDAYMALVKEAGLAIDLQVLPWSRAMAYMKDRPIMIGQLAPTDERKDMMYFIGPHAKEDMILAVSKKFVNSPIHSLDDLVALSKKTGRNVAYQQNVFYSKEFNARIEEDTDFQKYFEKRSSFDTVMEMLEAGRLLGFLDGKNTVAYRIKSKQKSETVAIHPFILSSSYVYFGVSKTISDETLEKLQEANKRLLANGTYERIAEKWDRWLQE